MHLGDPAPDFTAWTTLSTKEPLHFYTWLQSSWAVFFSYSSIHHATAQTELSELAQLQEAFGEINCRVLGISTDSLQGHQQTVSPWTFPVVADEDCVIAKLYGMLDSPLHDASNKCEQTGMPRTLSMTLVVDPQKQVRLILCYPRSITRNWQEVLRCVKELQK